MEIYFGWLYIYTEQITILILIFGPQVGIVKLFWFLQLVLYLSEAKHGYTTSNS